MSISPVNCKHSFISCEKTKNKDLYFNKKRGWDKSPSLSIIFGLSSKTQWLSGLYYADFTSFYSPTQLCGGGTTKRHEQYCFCPTPYFDFAFYGLCILLHLHDSDEVGAFGFFEFHFDIIDSLFEVWDGRILESVHSTAGFLDFICHELAAFFDFR